MYRACAVDDGRHVVRVAVGELGDPVRVRDGRLRVTNDRRRVPRRTARVVGDHAGRLAVSAVGLGDYDRGLRNRRGVLGDPAVATPDLLREGWHHAGVAHGRGHVLRDRDDVLG
jgi:hypothetical protein